jgi:hypothetical protein
MNATAAIAAALVLLASSPAHAGIAGAIPPLPPWDGTWPDSPLAAHHVLSKQDLQKKYGQSDWRQVLPPDEYDYPFPGKLIIVDEQYVEELKTKCFLGGSYYKVYLGCIHAPGTFGLAMDECRIFLARKSYVEMWYPIEWLLRHEIAH